MSKTPITLHCRICKNEPGMPDNIQTRLKLEDTNQDYARYANLELMYPDVPNEFAVLEEVRQLADALEKKLYPRFYTIRKLKEAKMIEDLTYFCPICGAENPETIYTPAGCTAVGCNECLCSFDPADYYEEVLGRD